jgi:D-glycero-D-manno-heptose 1,7-bisphosphate phosphatase
MAKAVFLDRDGTINEMIYYPEHGIVDSPFTAGQFRLLPRTAEAIKRFQEMGFKVIVISNQPGIAKGHFSTEVFEETREQMRRELAREGAAVDGEFYCLHHPEAKVARYKAVCDCRKPKPGLLIEAAETLGIDLMKSWMIGDGLTDIEAGGKAGCRTILLGRINSGLLCQLMEQTGARPDFVAADLYDAVRIVGAEDGAMQPAKAASEEKTGK